MKSFMKKANKGNGMLVQIQSARRHNWGFVGCFNTSSNYFLNVSSTCNGERQYSAFAVMIGKVFAGTLGTGWPKCCWRRKIEFQERHSKLFWSTAAVFSQLDKDQQVIGDLDWSYSGIRRPFQPWHTAITILSSRVLGRHTTIAEWGLEMRWPNEAPSRHACVCAHAFSSEQENNAPCEYRTNRMMQFGANLLAKL